MRNAIFNFSAAIVFLTCFQSASAQNGGVLDLIPQNNSGIVQEYEGSEFNEQTIRLGKLAGQIADKVDEAVRLSDELAETMDRYLDETDPGVQSEMVGEMIDQVGDIRAIYDFFVENELPMERELLDIRQEVLDAMDNASGETFKALKKLESHQEKAKRDPSVSNLQNVRILEGTHKLHKSFEHHMSELSKGQLAGKESISKFLETTRNSAYTFSLIEEYFETAQKQHDLQEGFDLLNSLDEMIEEILRANDGVIERMDLIHRLTPRQGT